MPMALVILLLVLFTISIRNILTIKIPIWLITVTGAIVVIVFKQITLIEAAHSVEPDVILYLIGVFFVSYAAEASGYLEHITDKIYYKAEYGTQALFVTVFILGLSSIFLMNDTVAIVGTPIILQLCKKNKNLVKPLLLALAFSVTIGSTMSPIGNPQNLLIAVKGNFDTPFVDFFKPLFIPTIINLIIAYLLLYIVYKKDLKTKIEKPTPVKIVDEFTVKLVKISFFLMLILLLTKMITDTMQFKIRLNFSYIALISAVPILFSKNRFFYLKKLDWGTLAFFASTFILIHSVWDSGFIQEHLNDSSLSITTIASIFIISVILSQFISNVPLVALYLPLLVHNNLSSGYLLALAVGSTIAGNMTIMGAASNIIIIHNAEKRQATPFGFTEFIKLGAPLVIINLCVYSWFLKI